MTTGQAGPGPQHGAKVALGAFVADDPSALVDAQQPLRDNSMGNA
jgi:hypothetical protein